MRDERGARGPAGLGWTIGAAGCLAACAAQAQGLSGHVQVQYQNVEQQLTLLNLDGTTRQTAVQRELWVQTYELNHAARVGENLNVFSQFRLSDMSRPGREEGSRTPYGTLRLTHPLFGLNGSYRPTTTTGAIGPGGFGSSGAANTQTLVVTTRNQEALLTGYLAPVRLPRLDLSWIRRHRNLDALSPEETGLSRSARLSYELGALNLRGGYGDLTRETAGGAFRSTFQRSVDGGADYRLILSQALSFQLGYDFAQNRRGEGGPRRDLTRTHAGNLTGSLRHSERADWSLFYGYRRTRLENSRGEEVANHEGSLLFNVLPSRVARLSAGGGVRTAGTAEAADLLRYLTAVVSADGDMRPGWRGVASASHVTNWNPGKQVFSVESYRAGSRFTLRKGLALNGNLQVTANGDTAARDARVVTQGSMGLAAAPWRALNLNVSERRYRAGRGLLRTSADSRASALDVRWRPVAGLELGANVARSGALPRNDPRLATTQLTLQWNRGTRFQLSGNYSRSDQTRRDAVAGQLTGREILGARLLAGFGKSLTLSAGLNVADPDRSTESRQLDASLTRTFGR